MNQISVDLQVIVEKAISLAKEYITSVWTDEDDHRMMVSFVCEDIKREDLEKLTNLEDYLDEVKKAYDKFFFTIEFSYIGQHTLLYSKGGGFEWQCHPVLVMQTQSLH